MNKKVIGEVLFSAVFFPALIIVGAFVMYAF